MKWNKIKYSSLPPTAKKLWDRDWDLPEEYFNGPKPDFGGRDPSTPFLGDENLGREFYSDGFRAFVYQPGYILKSSDIYFAFDGYKWFTGSKDHGPGWEVNDDLIDTYDQRVVEEI